MFIKCFSFLLCVYLASVYCAPGGPREQRSPQEYWWYNPTQTQTSDGNTRGQLLNWEPATNQNKNPTTQNTENNIMTYSFDGKTLSLDNTPSSISVYEIQSLSLDNKVNLDDTQNSKAVKTASPGYSESTGIYNAWTPPSMNANNRPSYMPDNGPELPSNYYRYPNTDDRRPPPSPSDEWRPPPHRDGYRPPPPPPDDRFPPPPPYHDRGQPPPPHHDRGYPPPPPPPPHHDRGHPPPPPPPHHDRWHDHPPPPPDHGWRPPPPSRHDRQYPPPPPHHDGWHPPPPPPHERWRPPHEGKYGPPNDRGPPPSPPHARHPPMHDYWPPPPPPPHYHCPPPPPPLHDNGPPPPSPPEDRGPPPPQDWCSLQYDRGPPRSPLAPPHDWWPPPRDKGPPPPPPYDQEPHPLHVRDPPSPPPYDRYPPSQSPQGGPPPHDRGPPPLPPYDMWPHFSRDTNSYYTSYYDRDSFFPEHGWGPPHDRHPPPPPPPHGGPPHGGPPPPHDYDRRPPPPPPHHDRGPPPPPPHDRRPPPDHEGRPPDHYYDRPPPPRPSNDYDYDRRPPPPPRQESYDYNNRQEYDRQPFDGNPTYSQINVATNNVPATQNNPSNVSQPMINHSVIENIFGKNPELINQGPALSNDNNFTSNVQATKPPFIQFQVRPVTPES